MSYIYGCMNISKSDETSIRRSVYCNLYSLLFVLHILYLHVQQWLYIHVLFNYLTVICSELIKLISSTSKKHFRESKISRALIVSPFCLNRVYVVLVPKARVVVTPGLLLDPTSVAAFQVYAETMIRLVSLCWKAYHRNAFNISLLPVPTKHNWCECS